MRPGWVKPCTCGTAERGAYCPECRGFGDGFDGGTWEHPKIQPMQGGAGRLEELGPLESNESSRPAPSAETWCPGGHRGATIRGNSAYCSECGGRLKPTHSSSYSHGTGH